MPRFFALSYFFFSLLFCSVSFAADDVPKEQQKIKQAVISNNQNYLYQELIAIQKQFTVLEVKLAQQNDSEKVKELEADFKKLNEDLIKLQELVDSNDKLKISELSNVDSRISDLTISTDRWGYTFSFFSLVITVAAIAMGISVVNKTKVEARKAAKLASDEWFKENQPNLFKPIREEVSSVRDNFESYIEEYDVELKKLKYEHEQHISALQDKALKEALSEAEKQEINASRTPDSETEFSLQDHFSAGIKAYINDDFSTAIQHWKRVSLSTDFENEASVISKSMFNLGITYGQEKSPSEEIEIYKQLIEQFTGHDNEEIQLQVAKAMMNLGVIYGQEKSPSEEIDMYKQLIEQFTGHDNEEIQLQVAKAMMNLGITYGQEKSPSEAIETYQQLIEQFTGHNNEEIQLQVAKTMMNLGITYGQEKLFGKVISIFDELVQNFEGHDSAEIQGQVKVALANSAELSILFDEPKDVISRIEKVDLSNPDEQTATVMKLMRFLLDNVAFKEIVNSVELLPSDIELTWTFNEIKGYINDHFTGLKRQQIDAVVRFFEEHKDKEKFLEEARELQE